MLPSIHPSIHPCMHACMHACMQAYIHARIITHPACMHIYSIYTSYRHTLQLFVLENSSLEGFQLQQPSASIPRTALVLGKTILRASERSSVYCICTRNGEFGGPRTPGVFGKRSEPEISHFKVEAVVSCFPPGTGSFWNNTNKLSPSTKCCQIQQQYQDAFPQVLEHDNMAFPCSPKYWWV